MENLKPEILAPAGSYETLLAAMEAGADAVYFGLDNFSARNRARNFPLKVLEPLITLLHQKQIKAYLCLNTLIYPGEEIQLEKIVRYASNSGIDGIIIQDLGLMYFVRQNFPNLAVHISTQATIYSPAAVNFFKSAGVSRIIIARELTSKEVEMLSAITDVELELFVHGALCYSYSGQCQFSNFLTGKSANRGFCIQPCRWKYQLPSNFQTRTEVSPFSLKDLSLFDQVYKLKQLKISALKIEGRLRNYEYVYNSVRAFRLLLDNPKSPQTINQAAQYLSNACQRDRTEYYFNLNSKQTQPEKCYTGNYTSAGQTAFKVLTADQQIVKIKTISVLPLRASYRLAESPGRSETIKLSFSAPQPADKVIKLTRKELNLSGKIFLRPGTIFNLVNSTRSGLSSKVKWLSRQLSNPVNPPPKISKCSVNELHVNRSNNSNQQTELPELLICPEQFIQIFANSKHFSPRSFQRIWLFYTSRNHHLIKELFKNKFNLKPGIYLPPIIIDQSELENNLKEYCQAGITDFNLSNPGQIQLLNLSIADQKSIHRSASSHLYCTNRWTAEFLAKQNFNQCILPVEILKLKFDLNLLTSFNQLKLKIPVNSHNILFVSRTKPDINCSLLKLKNQKNLKKIIIVKRDQIYYTISDNTAQTLETNHRQNNIILDCSFSPTPQTAELFIQKFI